MGAKQSRSRISSINSSDESIENNEPPAKRRLPVCMPRDSSRKKDLRHMSEMMGDRSHRSKYIQTNVPNCAKILSGLSKSWIGALQGQSIGLSGIPSMFGRGLPSGVYTSQKQGMDLRSSQFCGRGSGNSLPSPASKSTTSFP
ncbi:hypothetical protein NPIL_294931 [Nephila pilipes]|uniref:Uncharacterized protein n=1 Tax=Nephila pilipes TaxID=299642 RepID=A0A8X6T097_NEPPI|nr:hypothetical protein NPIL_294931 [Nephila pilipes]